MLAGISLFNPIGGLGQDVVGWLGHAISEGIGSFASWAIGGVIHAMSATTTPNFASWFKGPWRAMLSVVAWLSIPVLFFGVGAAALRGDLTSVLRRGLGAPVIMALATAVTLPVTAGLLTLVNTALAVLQSWSLDHDPLVRRFASKATRPRGVWCPHVLRLKEHPELAANLLESLHRDDARYVQLSVGNWLNDAARSRPAWVVALCVRWLLSEGPRVPNLIIRRALRNLDS